jgi:cytochrome P450
MSAPPPPGPKGRWLTGSLAEFRRDMLGFYTRCACEFGDVAGFRLGPERLCLAVHPDHVEHILTAAAKNFDKLTYVYRLLVPVLGSGLLTSEGDLWLRQRRLIQPAFSRQRLAGYGRAMVEQTARMLGRWRDGQTRDLHADMMQLALEIVGTTLFGADVASDAAEVGHAIEIVMDDFIARWESLLRLPMWIPTPANLRFRRTMRRLDAVVYRLIAERRRAGAVGDDLLSLLLQARDEGDGRGMTDRQVRDEAMTLFLAGHETTANALAWTWYLLATHPEEDAKLHAELRSVLGDRPPTVEDVPRLGCCERVVLEAMRLYPPAWGFSRRAKCDLELGGYHIRRGTTVVVCQWVTHRDGRWFDEPNAFRPDRWTGDFLKRLPRYAYFPFGGGPRVCIGKEFAMLEAVLIVAAVALRYRFSLVPGHQVVPRAYVTLRPGNGVKAALHRREG